MAKRDPWYKQCRYESDPNPDTGQVIVGTSWIPEELAKKCKRIYFGQRTDTPKQLFTVVEVFARRRESFLVEHMMDYKHQREMSDI